MSNTQCFIQFITYIYYVVNHNQSITDFQYGRAPIHWAASRGNIEIMELLIAAKCDIEVVDKVIKFSL